MAIGGVLHAVQVGDCARAGAAGVALVRALQPLLVTLRLRLAHEGGVR